jgi:hypothetical protein
VLLKRKQLIRTLALIKGIGIVRDVLASRQHSWPHGIGILFNTLISYWGALVIAAGLLISSPRLAELRCPLSHRLFQQ